MKKISINSHDIGRYDDVTPFIVTENELELKIALPAQSGEYFFVAECAGHKYRHRISRDGTVILSGLNAGELHSTVKHYLHGNLLREYKIEPLQLVAVDGEIEADPIIAQLQRKNESLEKALKEAVGVNASIIKALIRFAFKDYQNNVYLNGGDIDAFIEEFDFDEAKEQIKAILGGK